LAPHELEAINALTSQVELWRSETNHQFELLNTKLFGAESGENEHGRIPALEAAITSHEKRIKRQERRTLLQQGAVALLGVFLLVAEFLYHVRGALSLKGN
jgi:hypothetical protein